jgi:PAS domain S-box-containing protein
LRDAKGEFRYLEGVITVETDRRGNQIGVRGVVRDITDQKTAEQALKESEERYRQLVELSPQAIAVHTEDKFTISIRQQRSSWGASSPEELIGRSIYDFVDPRSRQKVRDELIRCCGSNLPSSQVEQRCVRLDGEFVDVEVTGIPFTSGGKSSIQAVFAMLQSRSELAKH